MSDTYDVGVLYTIWQSDEGTITCSPEDAPIVDRAMKQWAESRRDSWVSIVGPTGSEFSVLASTITSTSKSTPECRAASSFLDKAIADERTANRLAAGFIESE
jgi:hypothetical protein